MGRAFIALGSNIEPEKNIEEALRLLSKEIRITGLSTVYRTEPVGMPGRAWFLNCVVEAATSLGAKELKFSVLRRIEDALGRVRGKGAAPERTIDLDLILYGDFTIVEEGLVLPDPEITSRPFLAIPLFELDPVLVLPGSRMSLCEVAASMRPGPMEPLKGYTEKLKKTLGL